MSQQAPTQTVFACSQCGRTFDQSNLLLIAGNWICGECKPAYLSRVMAGGSGSVTALRYAGVGIRFGARLVDGLVFLVPFLILAFVFVPSFMATAAGGRMFNPAFFLPAIIFALFYEVLMLRYWGATLGKMASGIKVVRADGSGLGWGISFARYFMYNIVISAIPLINWILLVTTAIMAGTDEQKRGLHDRVCDTRVIYKRSEA
ncbi:MAG TPA: RDD family protein [Verrucomicrobiae bacterium]|jgi:uncharacterized RDD family membrane protein YckC|nr:RDD family protein [Verrucomicrobiae bacterium]